ncbi:MAG: acetyltransferase [Fervidobacterium sp.]
MKLIMIGAGGHGKVVLSTALEMGIEVIGILDDTPEKWNKMLLDVPILGPISLFEELKNDEVSFIIAIGDNLARKKIAMQISKRYKDVRWATLIHPKAYVHSSAKIEQGSVVFAGAIVQPYARIGEHTIINTAAVVEHDCNVGNWVHLAPGVRLAGSVTVKDGAFLGVGSVVIPLKEIGEWTTIGAGSVVVRDIPQKSVAYGVPAKVHRSIDIVDTSDNS